MFDVNLTRSCQASLIAVQLAKHDGQGRVWGFVYFWMGSDNSNSVLTFNQQRDASESCSWPVLIRQTTLSLDSSPLKQ